RQQYANHPTKNKTISKIGHEAPVGGILPRKSCHVHLTSEQPANWRNRANKIFRHCGYNPQQLMTLNSGTLLGPYQIQSHLGAGGMGEVYKARDVKLDRSVAIKVLPDALAQDP